MTGFPRRLGSAVAALLAGSTPCTALAQRGWTADLSVGRAIHDPVSAAVGTTNLSLGLRYGGSPGWLYLSGGTPLASSGSHWGAMGLGQRLSSSRGAVSLGVDAGAHLFSFTDVDTVLSGTGATLEALPFLALQRGPVGVEIRSGAVHQVMRGDTSFARTAHDSGMRFSVGRGSALAFSGEGRYLRVPEGGFPYAGAAAQITRGKATLWAALGRWLHDDLPAVAAGGGVGLQLGTRLELHAGWQQEPNDPLYWNVTRRTWSVRLSRSLGPVPTPTPTFPPTKNGRITIRIPLDESRSTAPSVLGDFTQWQPRGMTRSGGFWTATFAIPPGTYYYGFTDAEGSWFIPPSIPHQVDDGMGGTTAVLVVP